MFRFIPFVQTHQNLQMLDDPVCFWIFVFLKLRNFHHFQLRASVYELKTELWEWWGRRRSFVTAEHRLKMTRRAKRSEDFSEQTRAAFPSCVCVCCVFVFKSEEEEEKGHRRVYDEENIARIKPVQYLFIFYCGQSMLLSILTYNINKVFYRHVFCLVVTFHVLFIQEEFFNSEEINLYFLLKKSF